jgi:hypothetical protein
MRKQQFTLYLENKPGVLARITRRLANAKVNLEGISVANSSDVALVQMVVSRTVAARKILKDLGVAFTVQDVAVVPVRNTPGGLAAIVDRLAAAKVNINYVYATACDCVTGCKCCSYVVISAPDLKRVDKVWREVAGSR